MSNRAVQPVVTLLGAATLALFVLALPSTTHARGGGGYGGGGYGGGGAAAGGRSAPTSIARPSDDYGDGQRADSGIRPDAGYGTDTGNVARTERPDAGYAAGNAARADRVDANVDHPYDANVDNRYDDYHGSAYANGGYYAGGDSYGAAVASGVAAGAIGSLAYSLPTGCTSTSVNDNSYFQCGGVWYQPQFQGDSVSYVVVNAPN